METVGDIALYVDNVDPNLVVSLREVRRISPLRDVGVRLLRLGDWRDLGKGNIDRVRNRSPGRVYNGEIYTSNVVFAER